MCAQSKQPDPRDSAIARLASEALKPLPPSGGEDCPEAGLIAAYADRGLAESERTFLEGHFAACARCQQLLAAFGTALDVEAPAHSPAAAAHDPVTPPPNPPRVAHRPVPLPQRWLWWLTPAFGAAAAALLWMVLRPAVPQSVQTAANYSTTAEPEIKTAQAPASVPVPSEAPAAKSRRDEQSLDRLNISESDLKKSEAEPLPQTPSQQPAPMGRSASASVPELSPAPLALAATAPATMARNQAVVASDQVPLRSALSASGGPRTAPSNELDAGTAAQLGPYTFASPDGSVSWRLGFTGSLEKSSDRGQTWQKQSSGVTVDLLAGSASSSEVAWIVGRAAVILRTTDGTQWQRIAPPASATGDWATVVTRNANSVTIVGADLRRFSTEDGGRTWMQQP